MQIVPWLLATSTLIAPAPRPVTGTLAINPADATPAVSFQRTTRTPAGASTQTRMHRLGLGGTVTVTNRGAGASFRYWANSHLGLSMSANWTQSPFRTTTGGRNSALQASPSVMYLFLRPDPDREVDIRPYVGAGMTFSRASLPVTASRTSSYRGTVAQAYTGVELSFKEYRDMTISAEWMYQGLPDNYVSAYNGRSTFLVAVHFYLR
jgi:hypothetical protein